MSCDHEHVGLLKGKEVSIAFATSMADDAADCLCQKFISSAQYLHQAGCISLLVQLPHEVAHGPVAVIQKPGMAAANINKRRAIHM